MKNRVVVNQIVVCLSREVTTRYVSNRSDRLSMGDVQTHTQTQNETDHTLINCKQTNIHTNRGLQWDIQKNINMIGTSSRSSFFLKQSLTITIINVVGINKQSLPITVMNVVGINTIIMSFH